MTRRPFRRAPGDERRAALIRATLDCIAEVGVAGATVREIAQRAEVTNGLVRHHFESKEQMIRAAYREFVSSMTASARDATGSGRTSPRERLRRFVRANLSPPIMDARTVSIWAAFVNLLRSDPALAEIHREQYAAFRREIEELLGELFATEGREASEAEVARLAVKINAIIDGLWLEGGLAAELFEAGELPRMGVETVEATLGSPLREET